VRAVFEAHSAKQAIRLINAVASSARLQFRIESKRNCIGVEWRVDDSTGIADQLRSAVALNLAFLLERFGIERFRVCATSPCRDTFVDVSKNGARRYCGTTCANRGRVASFRERQSKRDGIT
jgi:predicted RNA-binding Zn ribbon-like protein